MVSFVNEHGELRPVVVMCRTIFARTFHTATNRPPSARTISDARHAVEIRRVWTANYSCYGPRRVHKQLRREGYVNRVDVQRGDQVIDSALAAPGRFTEWAR